jgi:flagellar biosynthesis component FlhA
MNQTIAEASLDNLHDIIVPDTIGFFPLAPGWYILFLLLLTLLFYFGYQRYKMYEREQYRRDAEEELEALNNKNRENTIALLDLAKRVAISAYGREIIATLDGDRWWDFMETYSKTSVSSELRSSIEKLLYEEDVDFDVSVFDAVFLMVSQWVETHKGVPHV